MSSRSIMSLAALIREFYGTKDIIPLHAPTFRGNERNYVIEAIESTFVSSVGGFVDRFERDMETYTGSERAVAAVNGTAALHLGLILAGVRPTDLVITQPLTFVATCNAIAYCQAEPVFVDVDRRTFGLSPSAMEEWLQANAIIEGDLCVTKVDRRIVRACLPMHTFGMPADLDGLLEVCRRWRLVLVEDAAEALGSLYKGRHVGTFGCIGTLSFNGNKIITTGGGGMILASEALGARAKHLSTTAKKAHPYEYVHDEIGFNYRLPNLNAALGCAQLEQLEGFIARKRALADVYRKHLADSDFTFVNEPAGCRANFWLNSVICEDRRHRDALLEAMNGTGILARPVWTLMTRLTAFRSCLSGSLDNAEWLEGRVVNLPSGVVSRKG